MAWQKALTAAVIVAALALAGCTGGGGEVAIQVTPADDPVTEPYVFEASGSADRFVWDFGDGTGTHEGQRIEHVFGFTDGRITVRLVAHQGDGTKTATTQLTLGTGQNTPPDVGMVATTDWVTPGQAVRVSGAPSTDEDGDPILFRWSCRARGEPQPAHGHAHGGGGGVPFGVQVLANETADVPAADRTVDGDLCAALQADNSFSRDATIEGSFDAVGVYDVDVEVRDPKSAAFVGRVTVYVTGSVPPANATHAFDGTLPIGSGGSLQEFCDELGQTCDQTSETFSVDVPNRLATITFDSGGGAVQYRLARGSPIVDWTTDETVLLDALALLNGQPYEVTFRLAGPGVNGAYAWTIDIEQDLDPTHLWEAPV